MPSYIIYWPTGMNRQWWVIESKKGFEDCSNAGKPKQLYVYYSILKLWSFVLSHSYPTLHFLISWLGHWVRLAILQVHSDGLSILLLVKGISGISDAPHDIGLQNPSSPNPCMAKPVESKRFRCDLFPGRNSWKKVQVSEPFLASS